MTDSELKARNDKLLGLVKQHCGALFEHFDSVQILCQKHDQQNSRGTVSFVWGSGNYYARYGQAKQWILIEEDEAKRSGL